ncbi:MAG: ABC transporter substrate-binding protein [Oxalicibacterium faecigallinarum]|uniref:ABC transporter substrate-binding protein n=1 Tax=Oxalicibacterium faecigallinarum TaxID=573741 RepID=UPI002809D2AE|nr:ABC transporter substrate-binding protein [Oxalicibacterium faecigallinarum]MDQ7970771.1 ABC transporter substrate-binding protein [Oxalicibacterium faecigallinarum]
MRHSVWKGMLATILLAICQHGMAEEGVTDNAIVIGQTIGITGPVAGTVKEMNAGAQAYFAHINKLGGVNGRKIELRTLDDRYLPDIAASNARALIEKDKVFALFQSRGTPQTLAILAELSQHKIPLIAPATGAESVHVPLNRYVFNVRAKYQDEVVKAIEHFTMLGMKDIALLTYEKEDPLGHDGLLGFNKGMAQHQLTPSLVAIFPRANPNVADVAKKLINANPSALIIVSSGVNTVEVIKAIRAQGGRMQIMTLSNNASQDFVVELGKDAAGIVVSQITPPPTSSTTALGKEFQGIAKAANVPLSYAAMEGYMSAKVLVEGLRRAGRNLTRESLIKALESMQRVDIGGVLISYSARDHTGSDYVELTLIGKDGRYVR